jgi:hypothetical protein
VLGKSGISTSAIFSFSITEKETNKQTNTLPETGGKTTGEKSPERLEQMKTTTTKTGKHYIFNNGVTASIQASENHYCEIENGIPVNYEIACWKSNREWITREYENHGDDVIGYFPIERIRDFLKWCKDYPV